MDTKGGSIITFLILSFIFLLSSVTIVKTGYVGVKYTFGKINYQELGAGLHFKIPLIQTIEKVDVRLKSLNYKAQKDTNLKDNIYFYLPITALDSRGLPITIEETVNVLPNPDAMAETISEIGKTYLETVVHPVVREVTRNIVGQYKAEEIPEKRAEISVKIKQEIEKKLMNYKVMKKPLFRQVEVQVRDIRLPLEIQRKIEEVQMMKQEAEKKKLEVEKAKYEQQVRLIQAETEMKERIIRANATAQEILIKAKAQANANREIASSLTPKLLEYQRIQTLKLLYEAIEKNPNVRLLLTEGNKGVINYWISDERTTFKK